MEHLTHKQKMTIMVALIVSMFFAAINQTIVSSSMPRIIAELGGMEHYSWVITIFMLSSTVATILTGKLSDIYGRKPFLLFGIIVFMTGAFLTGLSTNIFQMIIYRGIQGVGAGILMSTTITAVGDLFAPRERAKWTGLMMSIFGFSSVLGPTLGGFMIDHMDWKWLFWAFLPLGVVAFVLIVIKFPKVERSSSQSIDYWGSLVLSLSIISLLLAFSWGGTADHPWGSKEVIGLFVATVIGIIIFIFIEKKAKSPVLPLTLFKNNVVNISFGVGFLMNAGMLGAMIYLPFYVQGVQGLSPTQSGLVNIPMSISMIVVSTIGGRLIAKTGRYKIFAIAGIVLMIISMLMLANMNSIGLAVASMGVFGIGLGLALPVFTLTVQNAVPSSQIGVVTAASTLFRNLGGTIGIAILGSVLNSTILRKLTVVMSSEEGVDFSHLDPKMADQFKAMLNPQILLDQPKMKQLLLSLPAEVHDTFQSMIDMLRFVLDDSLSTVFYIGGSLLFVALILALFLKEIPLRTSEK